MKRTSALLGVVALMLALPATAQARQCARSATLVSGTIDDVLREAHLRRGARLRRGYPYAAGTAIAIDFQGVRYKVAARSEFLLACFGHTRSEGALFPRLELHKGHASATFSRGKPGAISTVEGMADPFANKAMGIAVERSLSGAFGITQIRRTSGAGDVNVTPYAGPSPGRCRQVRRAKLISNKRGGRAEYRG